MLSLIRNSICLVCLFLLTGCQSDDAIEIIQTLEDLTSQNSIEVDNVIACAAGGNQANQVIAYVYPRPGSSDLRFFATNSIADNKDDYSKYEEVLIGATDFFNGYLMQFVYTTSVEKWIIITFKENGILHLSNPIRLKHLTQNTEYSSNILIDINENGMPKFSWTDAASSEDAIYFEVVSNDQNDLLSGTYTFDTSFTYYDTSNVVLNITRETPPILDPDETYEITVMGVSEDNWVNIFLTREF